MRQTETEAGQGNPNDGTWMQYEIHMYRLGRSRRKHDSRKLRKESKQNQQLGTMRGTRYNSRSVLQGRRVQEGVIGDGDELREQLYLGPNGAETSAAPVPGTRVRRADQSSAGPRRYGYLRGTIEK